MTILEKLMQHGLRSPLCWIMVFFSTGVLLSAILLFLPLTNAHLVIELDSKITGDSQLFFGENRDYTQANSTWQHIVPGKNTLVFSMHGTYSSLRWDVLDGPGAIKVNDIYLSLLGKKLYSNSITLTPIYEIEQTHFTQNNTEITTKPDAKDPQIDVNVDFEIVQKQRVMVSLLLGFLCAAFLLTILFFRKNALRLVESIERPVINLINLLRADGINTKEFGCLFAIGSIFYIYFLSTFSFSIDDEMAAVRLDPAAWISQGRWFVYLVERFVFPQSSIPFAPYIFLIVTLAISYSLILRLHNYKPNWKTYFTYPIFCAFPTWWFISEFYSNVPALAFGMLFVSFSAYLFLAKNTTADSGFLNKALKNIFIVLMLACAVAAYQSLILFFITVIFGSLLIRTQDNAASTRQLAIYATITLFRGMLLVLLSIATYSAINVLAQKIVVADSGYIGNFINIKAILDNPFEVARSVLSEMGYMYTGDASRFGVNIGLSALIIAAATFSIFFTPPRKSAVLLILWTGVLVAPFIFNVISGGSPLPMRAMLAISYVSWLSAAILLTNKRPLALAVSCIVIALYQIQIFSTNSQYMASATITQAHDRMLAADIYRRIGELNTNFDRTAPIELDVFGKKNLNTLYANGWSSTMQGSFFSWDNGNLDRMVTYMRVMGYENLSTPTIDERIATTPLFKEMPVWPSEGSVKKVGNRYLVRLSKESDPTHEQFKK